MAFAPISSPYTVTIAEMPPFPWVIRKTSTFHCPAQNVTTLAYVCRQWLGIHRRKFRKLLHTSSHIQFHSLRIGKRDINGPSGLVSPTGGSRLGDAQTRQSLHLFFRDVVIGLSYCRKLLIP